jgi:hypothetical protein
MTGDTIPVALAYSFVNTRQPCHRIGSALVAEPGGGKNG